MKTTDLNDVIAVSDMANNLIDVVVHALINVGGDGVDLAEFMKGDNCEAKKNRSSLVSSFVKSLTNDALWRLVDSRIQLGEIDFALRAELFAAQYRIHVSSGQHILDRVEQPPIAPSCYTLVHEDMFLTLDDIAKKHYLLSVGHAGWRELLAFGVYLKERRIDLRRYDIFALGSSYTSHRDEKNVYPRLTSGGGSTYFDWTECIKPIPPASRRRFYLVRRV